jgi:octaprenyl-diphosphate synthase
MPAGEAQPRGNTSDAPVRHGVISRLIDAALDGLLLPVREDYNDVRNRLDEVLTAEINTAAAVSAYVARNKGKGLRPALVLLAARAIGDVTEEVRSAAVGIELLQASTLLHDDVIDDSPIRRGNPSVNAQWGNEVAVLMGDMLFTQALALFVSTGSLSVMDAAARQTRLLIEGEIFARELRAAPDFSEDSYLELIRRKTGALMSLSSEVGAMLTGADEERIELMREYGRYLGMAFQIADDILDVVGDPRVVGKPTGQDIREGTVTLPLIRALNAAPESDAAPIIHLVTGGVSDTATWDSIRRFIEDHKGVESARETARIFSDRAKTALATFPKSPARRSMSKLLEYVVDRKL